MWKWLKKSLGFSSNDSVSTGSGYDAARGKNKRRTGNGVLRSEDDELRPMDRKKLLSSAQLVYRNFSLVRWMVARHLDYVSTFTFQAKCRNPELNTRLESLVRHWSKRKHFETSERFSRARFSRMAELQRTLSGDLGVMRLRNGKVQGIEGDRIRTPYGGLPPGYTPQDFIHGVRTAENGRHLEYCVCRRGKSNDSGGGTQQFTFERMIPARNLTLFSYVDRFDQTRGISPLASALNNAMDCYEASDYALARMKIEQLIGLVFTREKLGEGGPLDDVQEDEEDEEDTDETDDDGNRYTKLDWGGGPVQVDLDPGDDLKFVTSQNPSAQFQQFMQMSIQVCLKALDIPYSFYAENFSNYSGSRQAMLQYNLASSIKRQDGQELLDELTLWRALLWIQDGQLEGVAPDDLAWQWVPTGLPWIDPLKEIQAQLAALGAKLTSRQRILRESGGGDFDDVVAELDYENKKLEAHNMSAEVVPGMIQDDEEQPQPMHGEQT